MNVKAVIIGFLLFALGQAIIWFQVNSQFLSEWASKNPFILALLGIPVSYLFIYATRYVVSGYDGLLWPGRMLSFASGMLVMGVLTWYFMNEGITVKTGVTLLLATTIVMVQIFWK